MNPHLHSFYDLFMAPFELFQLGGMRARLLKRAGGKVLELGAGTGANLPYYPWDRIIELFLTDVGEEEGLALRRWVSRLKKPDARTATRRMRVDAQELPFPSSSFDTVVATLLFCSVKAPERGLQEVRRVLQPSGRFIFIEHVRPLSPAMASLFDSLTPGWKRLASGCHLNRDTVGLIRKAGFRFEEFERPGQGVFVGGVAVKI